MMQFIIRIYDEIIRTNYIERRFQASDEMDALTSLENDDDILREKKAKFSTKLSLEELLNQGHYDLNRI